MTHIKNFLFIIAVFTLMCEVQAQTEDRNSTRSNTDQCCPTSILVEGAGGKTKELKVDLFSNGKLKGPVEVYATDKDGKAIDISKAISFSKDDKTLKVDTRDTFPENSIILEFRASGKSDKILLSNLKSWPPSSKFIIAKSSH